MLCGCKAKVEFPDLPPLETSTPIPSDSPTPTFEPLQLPISCEYNEYSYSLDNVEYYTDKDGKSYELFVVITLNVENIPDNEFDWFVEDTLKAKDGSEPLSYVKLSNTDNEIKSDSLVRIGSTHFTDTKQVRLVYITSAFDSYRYPFDICTVKINYGSKQKDKSIKNLSCTARITKDDIKQLTDAEENLKDSILKFKQNYYKETKEFVQSYSE